MTKNDIFIDLKISKPPYVKMLTNDNIINLAGQSGSGKTTYAKEHFSGGDYLIIDPDDIFSENRYEKATGINKELGRMFRKRYNGTMDVGNNFDIIYKDILDYCKDINKTIVIDSALFHCIKDTSLLKGKIIILRTDITTCYQRCIARYKKANPSATEEEISRFAERKKKIFVWYKFTNEFIKKIDEM